MFRIGLILTFAAAVIVVGFSQLRIATAVVASSDADAVTAQPTAPVSATPAPYTLIFSAEPGPDVSTLPEIVGNDNADSDILRDIVDYYAANKDRLAILWREDNPTRLAGLFSMYVTHISTIYGEVAVFPSSLNEYLHELRAHCGTYTWAQMQIADALGLTWRTVEFVGEHAWLEIQVDSQWEVFDATTNTWLSRGEDELMQGTPRTYRQFYTPMLDANRQDARLHLAEGYNMQRLRQRMPGVGITYMPPGELKVSDPVVGGT